MNKIKSTKTHYFNKPGNFFDRNDAFVMAPILEKPGLLVVGERAILTPIGPSPGCPEGLFIREFLIALVT